MTNANEILQKTLKIRQKSDELSNLISSPSVIADNKKWRALAKEHASLQDIVLSSQQLEKALNDLAQCEKDRDAEHDHELKHMFEEECESLQKTIEELCEQIKFLLLPKDENDDANIIMEIRAAAGGEESALFATELLRMYTYYAEKHHWKIEISDINETELGGIKEVTFIVQGKGAYSRLKYEAGVHRVQRVPETESQGRIHTSTATVAVLPEVEEVDFEILDSDLRVDTYRASGAGGQHINKTDSAIRLTHLPTGIVVTCQDERSQIKNREKAMRILQSKLYELYQSQKDKEFKDSRRAQVGTGDRSERVRTYNYPQGRVTDHRVNVSSYDLEGVLNGDIDIFIDALILQDRTQKLQESE